ncbi:hypothetical protein KIN20_018313 [Parelaphostrongylus tenuis]|uniref:Uncharacterized protein n=1 Tax=Parelaphostrongylus tenuis TaxID=148309 RepID=A0AAD5MJ59_PARTN|nr:hypothetical protein KIN20_018313 [Parelaphostrongylus tenuis]
MEVQSLVQRLIMHAVTDVLEEQGRRAGLVPAVISAILNQLSIEASYSPLQCEEMVAASGEMAGPKGTCFTSGQHSDQHMRHASAAAGAATEAAAEAGAGAAGAAAHVYSDATFDRTSPTPDYFWNSLDHQYNHGKLVDPNVAGRDESSGSFLSI